MNMQRRSIQSQMIITLAGAAGVIFLVLFLAFNLLFSGFIKREAARDLKEVLKSVQNIILADGQVSLNDNEPRLAEIITRLKKAAKTRLLFAQYELILTDRKFQVLYPKRQSESGLSRDDADRIMLEIKDDRPLKNRMNEISIGDQHYYASLLALKNSETPTGYLVLLTDVSGLSNFRSLINKVLLLSFVFAGTAAVLTIMFTSSLMNNSVKKLCAFARAIGSGDFSHREMRFKETELQALSDDMNLMASRLLEQDRQQKQFFQNISHEFKTPLMSIQGYAEGIKYEIIKNREKACDIISHECTRLSDMVNDLLFISRFEAREEALDKKKTDLKAMLADCCDMLTGAARKLSKEIHLDLPCHDAVIAADEEKLVMAVSNLISNCIRHAEKKITVSLITLDKAIRITVTDDGAGFDEQDIPHLFKRFYKGKNGSCGLGLSIAQAIVEAHGGSITAVNVPSGAQFQMTLPSEFVVG